MTQDDHPRQERADPGLLAGVELGGTKCICVLARGPDEVLASETLPTREPEQTLPAIARILGDWRSRYSPAALGVASFGPLDLDPDSPSCGTLTSTPKAGWQGADLRGLAAGLPCAIDTDVNGAALAEGLWGAARGLRSWCYITLGTGVGAASIVEGRPVRGLGHSEAGHMRVPPPDPGWAGVCPFHGNCVEGLLSGPALAARAGMASGEIPDDHPVWDEAAQVLAALCHNLALTTAPQRIVIGGGVAQRRPHLLVRARAKLAASLGGYATGEAIAARIDDYLAPAALGDMAGPLGAIALARSAARA